MVLWLSERKRSGGRESQGEGLEAAASPIATFGWSQGKEARVEVERERRWAGIWNFNT